MRIIKNPGIIKKDKRKEEKPESIHEEKSR